MSKTFYLTTPLYYGNAAPHVGQVYTTVVADTIARYKRLIGQQVYSLAGIDEHGLKMERAARERSLKPRKLADHYSEEFRQAWDKLGLHFDHFVRTTEEHHGEAVQELFHRLQKNRFIYQGEYRGNYCVNCEAYVEENLANCPDCGGPAESISEAAYFFRLSSFQEKLLVFYQDNPDFVIPSSRMNEIASLVKGGLKDLPVTRTSLEWGIKVPDDEKHVFYVWFNALTAYLSGAGFPHDMARFRKLWPADVQLVGRDILRFHAVYWPAFLMAAGLEPPRRIVTHGWSQFDIPKTTAAGEQRVVTCAELSELLPADYVKYYLLRDVPLGGDSEFSYPALLNRVNADLANDLGNLTSRVLKMLENYFNSAIPEPGDAEGGDEELRRFSKETVQLYKKSFDRLQIGKALDSVWELLSVANRYVVANEPWLLARDRSKKVRLATVLYSAAETLRLIATLLSPVIPEGSAAILKQLGAERADDDRKSSGLNWGELKPGGRTGPVEAVYTRKDPDEFNARVDATRSEQKQESRKATQPSAAPAKQTQPGEISIEDFAKVEMKVGKILEAERVPNSDKLVKLQVDLGHEVRQLVAGIGKAYAPEALVGKFVVVVTNLKPAKLMGVVSNGMIVAASHGGVPVLATFTEPVVLGSRLK
ncbi:MAG: methionine--tRNA ligase [Acidobacteria bacterium]|nr:MAG: methionine--tRNA ligase [Acidobacteriota bacterium]